MLKRIVILATAAACALPAAGCYSPQEQNAANGAVFGAATGGIIGALATGKPGGALVGAAIGGGAGAVLGAASTPPGPSYRGPGPYYERGPYEGPGSNYDGPPPGVAGRYDGPPQAGGNGRCAHWDYDYDGNKFCRSPG